MVLVRSAATAGAALPTAVAAVAAVGSGSGGGNSSTRTSKRTLCISPKPVRQAITTSATASCDKEREQCSSSSSSGGGGGSSSSSSSRIPFVRSAVPRRYPFSTLHQSPSRRGFSTSTRSNASAKDPYATLGVKRDASTKDIKGAYYSLAKKFHPDTSKEKGAKERFVEIQSAYDILSDEKKKAAFDRYGTTDGSPGFDPFGAGPGAGNPFGGFGGGGFQGFSSSSSPRDAKDIFEGLFGAFGGGRSSSGSGFAGQSRGEDLETTMSISFEEACRGTTKNITIAPVDRCGTCSGNGMRQGARKRTCTVCNGTGTRTFVIQGGFQMASVCPACNGQGQSVMQGDECGDCDGIGRVRAKKSIDVKVPAGVEEGTKIRMDGQGDVPSEGPGPAGSLYVRIVVRPSKVWRRQGGNLFFPAVVPFHTAILGGRVRVPTLDGDVDVRVPPGTQAGDELMLQGRGVPMLSRRGDKGDLLVQFEITIPRSLSARQREILQQYVDDVEGRSTAPPPQPTPKPTPAPSTPPPPSNGPSKQKGKARSSPKVAEDPETQQSEAESAAEEPEAKESKDDTPESPPTDADGATSGTASEEKTKQ